MFHRKTIATANTAEAHKRSARPGGKWKGSTLFASVLRNSKNSIQPAMPAEAVRPARPSLGSRCNHCGRGKREDVTKNDGQNDAYNGKPERSFEYRGERKRWMNRAGQG